MYHLGNARLALYTEITEILGTLPAECGCRTLPNAGRYIQEDAPEKINEIMRDFLEENDL